MQGKILVVDDEETLVRLITYNLGKEGFTTIAAYDGSEVEALVNKENPDLIILDLMLPGKDGMEICSDLRRHNNRTPIIMLTARGEEIDRVLGLELGADDYVTKPFSVRELTARVKAALRRNREYRESETIDKRVSYGSFVIKPENYQIFHNDKILDLTLKEYELLSILLRNAGRVLKRDYLLEVLWDHPDSAASRVLDVHISKLREKIENDTRNPQHIKTVRGVGYRFEVPDND